MHKELMDFISVSRSKKISDEDIKDSLLSNGWGIKEVEETFFYLSGGDKSLLKTVTVEEERLKKNGKFATISLWLPVVSIIVFLLGLLSGPIVLLYFISATVSIIFSIIGINSNRKAQAIIGLVLTLLFMAFMILGVIFIDHAQKTGTSIFTGKQLSEQVLNKIGK